MSALGNIAATLLVMAYTAALSGWALSLLWAWFVVGIFAAPALTIPQAIGLSLIASYLTHQISTDRKEKREWSEELVRLLAYGTAKPLVALAFGGVVRWFL